MRYDVRSRLAGKVMRSKRRPKLQFDTERPELSGELRQGRTERAVQQADTVGQQRTTGKRQLRINRFPTGEKVFR